MGKLNLFLFMVLFASIFTDPEYETKLDECEDTNAGYYDCQDYGPLKIDKDKLNNIPDSCCRFDIAIIDLEDGNEGLHQCLQIKKAKVVDYVNYILDEIPELDPDMIKVKCDNELIYEWEYSSSYNIYFRFYYLFLVLFLLL